MVRKSLMVTIISFAIFFIPAFFVWYFRVNHKFGRSYFTMSALEFFFYSLPVVLVTFIVLLVLNSLYRRCINRKNWPIAKIKKYYFILTTAFAILIPLGFALIDYFQFNRLGSFGNLSNILVEYSSLCLFIFIVLFVNWIICYRKSFEIKSKDAVELTLLR